MRKTFLKWWAELIVKTERRAPSGESDSFIENGSLEKVGGCYVAVREGQQEASTSAIQAVALNK